MISFRQRSSAGTVCFHELSRCVDDHRRSDILRVEGADTCLVEPILWDMRMKQMRSAVPYVWPKTLILPDARVVYLDLKDWIAFAKVVSGHRDGRKYQEVFSVCQRAVESGSVVMPLSVATYAELMNRKSHRQRQDICTAIELLCDGYQTILSEFVLGVLELDETLYERGVRDHLSSESVPYIRAGVAYATGRRLTPRIVDETGRDVTAQTLPTLHPALQATLTEDRIAQMLSRAAIAGPSDESEEEELRSLGWNPESIAQMYETKAASENAVAMILAQEEHQPDLLRGEHYDWRNARMRDGVTSRELMDRVLPCLEHLGVNPFDVFDFDSSPDALRRNRELTDCLPTFDVAVTLKHSLHHDRRHWTVNDIFDITALTVALPYCDVVCTDKGMRHHIEKTGIAQRLQTAVIDNLHELPGLLASD